MYQRILAAIDATPNEAGVLAQTIQLARLTGAAVHVLHVALDHIGTGDILGGSAAADDVDPREVTVVQDALAQLREAGVTAEGELVTAPEHDIAAAIVERARDSRRPADRARVHPSPRGVETVPSQCRRPGHPPASLSPHPARALTVGSCSDGPGGSATAYGPSPRAVGRSLRSRGQHAAADSTLDCRASVLAQ